MSKDKSEVRTDYRAPFYATLYNKMKETALECGYALALHGSMASDMDILAVPWVEDCMTVEELYDRLRDTMGKSMWYEVETGQTPTEKPHNRVAYTIRIMGDWYIDLSVVKPIGKSTQL